MTKDKDKKVIIFTTNKTATTKFALDFMNKRSIPYVEKSINRENMPFELFMKMLSISTENEGVNEFISSRSRQYYELVTVGKIDIQSMKLSELYELFMRYPTLMKTPILITPNQDKVIVGGDEDNLYSILSREERNVNRELIKNSLHIMDMLEQHGLEDTPENRKFLKDLLENSGKVPETTDFDASWETW